MATPNNACQQALQLDASASVDEDTIDDEPFEFGWYCENSAGGACLSRNGEALLDLASSASEAALYIPAGSLPIGKLRENGVQSPVPCIQSLLLSS